MTLGVASGGVRSSVMRRPLFVLLVLVLSATGLVACGGDDDDDAAASGGDTLSKDAFIEQGDAICADLRHESSAIEAPASEEEFGDYLRAQVKVAEAAREKMAALEPPTDGVKVQQALLDSLDAALESARGAIDAADSGDTVTAEDLIDESSKAADASDEPARDYGFEECGKANDS